MRHAVIRTFDEWLAQESVAHYPYEKTFEEAANDPFIVIHTSGSTGLPKPITLRHGGLATPDAHHVMPSSDGYDPAVVLHTGQGHPRVFVTLPPFHVSFPLTDPSDSTHVLILTLKSQMAGILGQLVIALYYRYTIIWPPAGRPVSTDMVDELLDNVEVDGLFLAPSVLEDLSQSESSLEKLRKAKFVEFGGGWVPHIPSLRVLLSEDQALLPDMLVIQLPNTPRSSTFWALQKQQCHRSITRNRKTGCISITTPI